MAIQQVQQGETITAAKTNELVAAANRFTRVFGDPMAKTTDTETETIIDQSQRWARRFQGQTYLEPFDLSIERATSSSKVRVLRPHLYLSGDNFYEIPRTSAFSIDLPAQGDISILLSSDVSGTLSTFGLCEDDPGGSNKCWCLWTLLSNGVVKEDLRSVALAGLGDEADGSGAILDLSSLDWNQTSAQLWHYNGLQQGDIADKAELTANNGWMFPVRPPDGEPHLKYVELNTMKDVVGGGGGGGGGGGCSCDLSVTPPATLSSLGQDLVQIADWTKDNWQTHVPILAPDVVKDIVTMANRLAYTPFYLRIRYNNGSPIMDIINNFFFYGREMKTLANYSVTQTGTYYLEIETNQYGYYISRIVREASTNIPPAVKQNDDTHTYYPLWVVTSVTPTWDTGFPFDCRPMYITPFYSN